MDYVVIEPGHDGDIEIAVPLDGNVALRVP